MIPIQPPDPDPRDVYEMREALAELIADGQVYATRDSDGELRFFAIEHDSRIEDAIPASEVIRELRAQDN